MRDSFLIFYDSQRDFVGQSNMRSSPDEVNTRVTVRFMRAFIASWSNSLSVHTVHVI